MMMSLATRAARAHQGVAFGGVAGFCARVLAFWFGSLSLLNVMAGLSHPAFDPNIWWIDLRFMPKLAGQLLLLAVGGLLVWHGLRPASSGWRRTLMTGGIEPTGIDETIVMRDLAVQLGVPSEAIILDPGGDNTNASVANTVRFFRDNGLHRILAVSQFYHLPRIKLAYARAGLDVWTVPASTSLVPRTLAIVAREVPAFWLYYLRAVVA